MWELGATSGENVDCSHQCGRLSVEQENKHRSVSSFGLKLLLIKRNPNNMHRKVSEKIVARSERCWVFNKTLAMLITYTREGHCREK